MELPTSRLKNEKYNDYHESMVRLLRAKKRNNAYSTL